MINLSFDELRVIAQLRNISDYENKSKEDLIKALRKAPKPETKPKPETTKPVTTKPETKPKPKPEPEPKVRVKTDKRKLKKLRKEFVELRHKFSKKEIREYRKASYLAKSKKHMFESELKKTNKNLNKLEKSLRFEKFHEMLIVFILKTLIVMIIMMIIAILLMMMNTEKIGSIGALFKELDSDYYKPVRTDVGLAGRNDNYI